MANKEMLRLVIIFVFSFLIRFFLISLGPYSSDALYLAIQSEKIVQTGQMQYLQSSGLPLTALLGAFFVWLFRLFSVNDPVLAVNLMSVVFGSLCVPAVFYCVRSLTDPRTAFISAALLALNPLFVGLSMFGNSHMPATFFLLLGIYFLLLYSHQRKNVHLFLAGWWLGCMAAARLQDFAVMVVPLAFLISRQIFVSKSKKTDAAKHFIHFFLPCLGVILCAYLPKFLITELPTGDRSFLGYVTINLTDHIKGLSPAVLSNILTDATSIFSPAERILMIVGTAWLAVHRQWSKILFLLLWIAVPAVIFGGLKFFVFRFLVITFIPLIVLEAYGVSCLSRVKQGWARFCIPVLFIFVLLNLNRYYSMFLFRHQNALLPEFFQWIGAVTEDGAYIIERDHSIWISHYAKRVPFGPKKGLSRLSPEDLDDFKQELDGLLSRNIPVYITKYGLLDQKDLFRKFMINNYRLEYVGGKMIEDWHLDCLKQAIVRNDLFRIKFQTP